MYGNMWTSYVRCIGQTRGTWHEHHILGTLDLEQVTHIESLSSRAWGYAKPFTKRQSPPVYLCGSWVCCYWEG